MNNCPLDPFFFLLLGRALQGPGAISLIHEPASSVTCEVKWVTPIHHQFTQKSTMAVPEECQSQVQHLLRTWRRHRPWKRKWLEFVAFETLSILHLQHHASGKNMSKYVQILLALSMPVRTFWPIHTLAMRPWHAIAQEKSSQNSDNKERKRC